MAWAALALGCLLGFTVHADTVHADAKHFLWELHGKHNTVYMLGSVHVLRASDYPLAPALLDAYRNAKSLCMEINLGEVDTQQMQAELLASAQLPEGQSLTGVMGKRRYDRAASLSRDVGVELSTFDNFAPWFAAEAISAMQLMQLGFESTSGVEMYFLERARSDAKGLAGLETLQDQIALFDGMSPDVQAEYLLSSLDEAHDLPKVVNEMVSAWKRGDTGWFEEQMKSEFGRDPALYQSLLVARNRKWVPKIEAMLNDDKNYLVIVGSAHLVGAGSVLDLLKKDGIDAVQK